MNIDAHDADSGGPSEPFPLLISRERRNEITALVLAIIGNRRPAKTNPVAYGRLVLAVQHCSDITRAEIDHVLVALCCRRCVNLIGGEVFFCGSAELLSPEALADPDRIDWLYGSGRYAR